MAQPQNSIDSLPNEILINALDSFATRSLLPVAAVSRRFRGLVGRLHYYRLVQATVLKEHELILECYHPSNKISTPYLFCKYLATDGLAEAGVDTDFEDMNKLYTRFKPFLGDENRRPRARRPTARVIDGADPAPEDEAPSHDIHLDAGELFSQLCVLTNLVKVGPRRGLFLSIVNVTDGVIRVWREWLRDQAARQAAADQQPDEQRSIHDPSILWTDASKNVGLRFRVKVKEEGRNMPVLMMQGDEPPVSYTLEYEELIVRTNRLLLSIESSEVQQVAHAGKAIIIASMQWNIL
ncbi:hypothetical protein F5Y16DRAFT_397105 [Xylariaceae sp. FL0255]|nr:hypothetical protein F5Y16DRAFT_397105 [Xylariaceae sp. FL0255]